MSINWQDVITALGGDAVLLAAAAWLIKALVSHRLTQDAESFKIQLQAHADQELEAFRIGLQANANTEIERLKSALQMTADERRVRFSKLHEERAKVIADIYGRALKTFQNGRQFALADGFTRDGNKQQQATINANKGLWEFYLFVERHRIYLPEQTCALLNTFVESMRKHVVTVGIYGSIEYPTT
jgi:hypothetical protein